MSSDLGIIDNKIVLYLFKKPPNPTKDSYEMFVFEDVYISQTTIDNVAKGFSNHIYIKTDEANDKLRKVYKKKVIWIPKKQGIVVENSFDILWLNKRDDITALRILSKYYIDAVIKAKREYRTKINRYDALLDNLEIVYGDLFYLLLILLSPCRASLRSP